MNWKHKFWRAWYSFQLCVVWSFWALHLASFVPWTSKNYAVPLIFSPKFFWSLFSLCFCLPLLLAPKISFLQFSSELIFSIESIMTSEKNSDHLYRLLVWTQLTDKVYCFCYFLWSSKKLNLRLHRARSQPWLTDNRLGLIAYGRLFSIWSALGTPTWPHWHELIHES